MYTIEVEAIEEEHQKLIAENKRLREVIEKLKEPTRLMWAAGGGSIVQSPHCINLHHDEVIKLVWFPMVEQALKENNDGR